LFSIPQIAIEHFVRGLKDSYQLAYGETEYHYSNVAAWSARLALENIANSDALYHNVDHTIMVTSVAQAIIKGKHLCEGGVTPRDWLHFIMAVLFHDIGYVRGVCKDDQDNLYATGVDDKLVEIPSTGTDVLLTPYHIDRSKLFVRERFGGKLLVEIDIDTKLIASYIEMTRFPPPDKEVHKDSSNYGGLVRAADFIGQLGDPNYLRKIPALFYEFEEIGSNTTMGYKNPGDMRGNFAKFYWNVVSPYVQDALAYLRQTLEGKQWIANLHSHVFEVEHGYRYLDKTIKLEKEGFRGEEVTR
jgi:hypothetical protein